MKSIAYRMFWCRFMSNLFLNTFDSCNLCVELTLWRLCTQSRIEQFTSSYYLRWCSPFSKLSITSVMFSLMFWGFELRFDFLNQHRLVNIFCFNAFDFWKFRFKSHSTWLLDHIYFTMSYNKTFVWKDCSFVVVVFTWDKRIKQHSFCVKVH